MENTKINETTEDMMFVNVIEENEAVSDMLCNTVSCA